MKQDRQDGRISEFFEKDIDKYRQSEILKKNKQIDLQETTNRLFYSAKPSSNQKTVGITKIQAKYCALLANSIIDDYFKNGLEQDEKETEKSNNTYENFRHPQRLKEYFRGMKGKNEIVQNAIDQSFPDEVEGDENNESLKKVKESKFLPKNVDDDIDKYFDAVFLGFLKSYEQSTGYLPSAMVQAQSSKIEAPKQNNSEASSQPQPQPQSQGQRQKDMQQKYQNYYKNLRNTAQTDYMPLLMRYYDKLDARQKSFMEVDFESRDNFETQLRAFYQRWTEEKQSEEESKRKAGQEQEERMKESLEKKVFRKDFVKKKTPLSQLKAPKDKYKTGQTMLELHTKFSKDRILNEMIVNEFKENRLSKYAMEYDQFDSDEEDMIKQRKTAEEAMTTQNVYKIIEGRRSEKIDDLSVIFQEKLNFYTSEKAREIEDLVSEKKALNQENKKMLRHLNEAAKTFIQMRKNRKKAREQKQKGLNQFISATFEEVARLYKKTIDKNYPMHKYGLEKQAAAMKANQGKEDEKKIKWKPFPPQFKKDFFELIRAYSRTTVSKSKKKKLPFWSPPSFNIHARTLNKKILELSRDVREENYEKEKNSTSVWDNVGFAKEREKIMMKFEEASNCTFNPSIGYRMSRHNRNIMMQSAIHQPQRFLEKPQGFEKAIEKMGDNFKLKFPWLYKRGIIKKAWFLIQKGEFPEAYSSLCDNFHIKSILKYFNPKQTTFLQDNRDSMFNFEKLGKREFQEDKIRPENFEVASVRDILREAFDQLQVMEAYERDVLQKIHLFEKRMSEDQRSQLAFYKMKKRLNEQVNQKGENESEEMQAKKQEIQKIIREVQDGGDDPELKKRLNAKKEEKMMELIRLRQQESGNDPESELKSSKSQSKKRAEDDASMSGLSVATQSTYASRRELVKNIMCPLGSKCPGFVGPRWHVSNVKACVPIGANCTFAHSVQELKFGHEIQVKKRMLLTYLKQVNDLGFGKPRMIAWNPAGNKFSRCLGCSQKTACSECKFKIHNKTVISALKNATRITNSKIVQKQSFKDKQKSKQIASDNHTFKLGCLQKANIFYKLERYKEAFEVISKAIEMVEKEVEEDRMKQDALEAKWRKQLKLNAFDGQEITHDTILMARSAEQDEQSGQELQKLEVYGIKTGLTGTKKPSANEFLNEQIEKAFLKIELALSRTDKDVELMRKKIGELEELQELLEQRDASYKANPNLINMEIEDQGDEIADEDKIRNLDKEEQEDKLREKRVKTALRKTKTKMCPDMLKNKRCPKGNRCRYAHTATELLLVKPDKLMKNLRNAIDISEKEKLFQFWNPSGNNYVSCAGCGICNFCITGETNERKIDLFRFASSETNRRIRAKETYATKIETKRERHIVSDRKQRILMKAKILLGQGFHKKAYDMILKAVKLVDMSFSKDEELNYEIEQMYLGLKEYLDKKYQDLVYMNLQIDEQQKLQEQAEIVDPVDRTIKPNPPPTIFKTKNHYIISKENNAETAFLLFKGNRYEDAQKLIEQTIEAIDKEPDADEDPFNRTLRATLKRLAPKKKRRSEDDYEDDGGDYGSDDKDNTLDHPLFRFVYNKKDLYDQAMDSLRGQDDDDEMMKQENKKNAIYLLRLANNYIRIEKQDLVYNAEVNKKVLQVKEVVMKGLNEKNRNYRDKQGILESAEKCIEGGNFIDGIDIIIGAIAIMRKEQYEDEQHAALNKKINTVYSVLKQGKFKQSLSEKPVLTPVPEPFKEKQENETRISAFRNLKHQRDRTLEEKQNAIEERVFKDPKTIGMVYPNSSIHQLRNAMYKLDQEIAHGAKYPSFNPTSTQQSKELFGESERISRIGEKTLWQKNSILNTKNKKDLEVNPFESKDQEQA